jgi:hypothetical protein
MESCSHPHFLPSASPIGLPAAIGREPIDSMGAPGEMLKSQGRTLGIDVRSWGKSRKITARSIGRCVR